MIPLMPEITGDHERVKPKLTRPIYYCFTLSTPSFPLTLRWVESFIVLKRLSLLFHLPRSVSQDYLSPDPSPIDSPSTFFPPTKLANSLDREIASPCPFPSAPQHLAEPQVVVSLAHPAMHSDPTRIVRLPALAVVFSEM